MEVPLARLVDPGAEVVAPPAVALAGLGVPLFFSWSPDGRYIVQVPPPCQQRAQRRHTPSKFSCGLICNSMHSLLCRQTYHDVRVNFAHSSSLPYRYVFDQ